MTFDMHAVHRALVGLWHEAGGAAGMSRLPVAKTNRNRINRIALDKLELYEWACHNLEQPNGAKHEEGYYPHVTLGTSHRCRESFCREVRCD